MQSWVVKHPVVKYQSLNSLVCNFRLQGCCKPGLWKAPCLPALSRRPEHSTSPSQVVLILPGCATNSQFTLGELNICCDKGYTHVQSEEKNESAWFLIKTIVLLLHFSRLGTVRGTATSQNKPDLGNLNSRSVTGRTELAFAPVPSCRQGSTCLKTAWARCTQKYWLTPNILSLMFEKYRTPRV